MPILPPRSSSWRQTLIYIYVISTWLGVSHNFKVELRWHQWHTSQMMVRQSQIFVYKYVFRVQYHIQERWKKKFSQQWIFHWTDVAPLAETWLNTLTWPMTRARSDEWHLWQFLRPPTMDLVIVVGERGRLRSKPPGSIQNLETLVFNATLVSLLLVKKRTYAC